MEVEEIQTQQQPCKYPRLGNGASRTTQPAEEEDQDCLDLKRVAAATTATATADGGGGNRLRGWHHSRIIRVSRASGGKDRHSKVWTSKGLRDRRVRLSVTTAIQFYDLQDRLGYDQPSKAVEWLIKAAADAISELPSLNNYSFPDTPKQLSDEKRGSCGGEHGGFDSAEVELDAHGDPNYHHQNHNHGQSQHLSLTKSACSSTSETSKGSGLSLSRSDVRVNRSKARERARERAAKDKEKESNNESVYQQTNNHNINNNSISQNPSFTELLTGGIGGGSAHNHVSHSPTASAHHHQSGGSGGGGNESILFHKAAAPMDYFGSGLLGLSSSTRTHHSAGFPGQNHLGMNSIPNTMSVVSPYNVSGEHHHHHGHNSELQPFSFVPDHLVPVTTSSQPGNGGGDFLNFSISSSSGGLAGFNRGTLQSNSSSSPSLLPHHLQRFSPIDGSSNVPFFIGAAAAAAAAPTMENHNHHHHQHHQQQFPAGFDLRLQQLYGDGTRHSDPHKGKAKN